MRLYKSKHYLLLCVASISAIALVLLNGAMFSGFMFNGSMSKNSNQIYGLKWDEQSIPSFDEKRQLIATLQALRMHNVTRNQRLRTSMEEVDIQPFFFNELMSSDQALQISQDSASSIAPLNLPNHGINSFVHINESTAIYEKASEKQLRYGW